MEPTDKVCREEEGCDYLTIPHNSNISNGRLLTPYANLDPTLENRVTYARARQRNEPMMEVFQHKGGSECLNGLSGIVGAPDELCDIEQVRNIGSVAKRINISLDGAKVVFDVEDPAAETVECKDGPGRHGMMGGGCVSGNDFLRTALLTGLAQQQEIGINPVKLGVVAASDGHTSTPGSVKESQWEGYVTGEMELEDRLKPGNPAQRYSLVIRADSQAYGPKRIPVMRFLTPCSAGRYSAPRGLASCRVSLLAGHLTGGVAR